MGKRRQRVARRRKKPLVVILTKKEEPAPRELLTAVAERARFYGWDLLDLRFTKRVLPENREIAGAIVNCLATDPVVVELLKRRCTAVRIGKLPHPKDNILPAVLPDIAAGARMAAEHFAERGFKHVGYVGRQPWSTGRSFYEAFRRSAAHLGCHVHLLRLKSEDQSAADRYKERVPIIADWLQGMLRPFGLVSFSDRDAAMLCTVCEKAGLLVPADVAVLGSGNSALDCDMAPVPLSSIDWAVEEKVRQAAALLRHIKRGGTPPEGPVIVEPVGVVTRRSTDMLALEDSNVARAVRFMWDHMYQDLSVDDVAAEVGVPRRRLERAFSKHLGRGIHAELRRKRLEHCCELLRSTDLRISDIAAEIGFVSADNLHLAFKREFGVTPRQYRIGEAVRT